MNVASVSPAAQPGSTRLVQHAVSDRLRLEIALIGATPDAETHPGEPGKGSPRPRTVLVVDDDPEMRTYLTRCLRNIDLAVSHVEFAANGVEALEKLASCAADLIITDLVMPRMDGFVLCEHLAVDRALRSIPILVVSGEISREEVRTRIPDHASVQVLSKPFNARMLEEAVRPLWE